MRARGTGKSRGLTLVEMMIAMVAAALVVFAGTVAAIDAAKLIARARVKVELNRDAVAALRRIQSATRGCTFSGITVPSGTRLSFSSGAYFAQNGHDLVYCSSGSTVKVINGSLSSVSFSITGGTTLGSHNVNTVVNVGKQGASLSMSSSTLLRN